MYPLTDCPGIFLQMAAISLQNRVADFVFFLNCHEKSERLQYFKIRGSLSVDRDPPLGFPMIGKQMSWERNEVMKMLFTKLITTKKSV